MGEWKEYRLDDIAEILDFKRIPLSSMERSNRKGQYPYYGASGIIDYLDDYIFEGEHVLISEDGENLRSRQTPIAFLADGKFWVNNHAHIVKSDYVHNRLICYSFANLDLNPYITGAVQPKLNQDSLKRIPLFLPTSLDEREKIVGILTSIDDKIDLLHRENATLEKMAETLFRQWFVVEANEEWEEGKLGDICNYITEKIDIDSVVIEDYISTENMCSNKQGVVRATSIPESGKATKYCVDDILLSNIRPYFKKIWLANKEGGCSADVLCIRSTNDIYAYFTYHTIRQDEFFDYVMLGSKGCKMPRGDKAHIMNWPIMIPPKNILMDFNRIVKNGIEKIRSNNKQIQTLIQTRDGLLPRLMGGEIKI
jgi:type I restriction enzyme S subunit